MGEVLHIAMTLEYVCNCYTCGVPITMTAAYQRDRRSDHKEWYCINGHPQAWTGPSEAEKLRRLLAEQETRTTQERERRERAERETSAARGQVTKIKNRVGKGFV